MSIKFIIFDLGGVCFTDGTTIALEKIKKLMKTDDQAMGELFRESFRKEGYLLRLGKITSEEFWKMASEKLNVSQEGISEIRRIWHGSYKPNKEMKDLLVKLRKNYKIVAFSNTIKERVKYLDEKYGLLKDFDYFVFSFERGMLKPDPNFYKKLLEVVDATAEECLFVDDKQSNLDIAESLGMKTILFKNPEQLKTDLKKFGIRI